MWDVTSPVGSQRRKVLLPSAVVGLQPKNSPIPISEFFWKREKSSVEDISQDA
jgi:hypothetical protein